MLIRKNRLALVFSGDKERDKWFCEANYLEMDRLFTPTSDENPHGLVLCHSSQIFNCKFNSVCLAVVNSTAYSTGLNTFIEILIVRINTISKAKMANLDEFNGS